IVKVDPELDLHCLPEPEVLEDRKVQVIDSRQLQGVSTAIRFGAGAGLNVLCVRIVGHVSNHSWTAVGYGVAVPVNSMHSAGSAGYSIQVDDRTVSGRVAVQVRIDAALNSGELAALECQGAGQAPSARNRSYPLPSIPEQRDVIDSRHDESLPVVECRGCPLTTQVLKVLDPPWRQDRAKDLGRSIINKVAPGVRRGTLQTARQAMSDLGRERIVSRIAVRQECHDVAAIESRIGESRHKTGCAGEYIGECRQACQIRRRWR